MREDNIRKDLLFAGTETGVYVSWNGGKDWKPFQLNLPLTPITDLRIHQGNLIAATSGRAFWILDDLSLVRQYKKDSALTIFNPSPAYLATGSSELDETDESFTGQNKYRGVNPSTGLVIYYQLPTVKDNVSISLEIKDAEGNIVRTFSSKPDSTYKKYDGAPPKDAVLSKTKGLNRFVWDMRYPTIPGITNAYIESSYIGHKASPGKYIVSLQMGDQKISTEAEVLANPLYSVTNATYKEYHTVMNSMETALTTMHRMINSMNAKRIQLESILANLPSVEKYSTIGIEGQALVKKMKAWDEDMIQRKSKAYDDVENFPNKFTANYMFLANQTENDIPRVNQPNLDLLKELNAQWAVLQSRGNEIMDTNIPAFNKRLWEAGVGAIWDK